MTSSETVVRSLAKVERLVGDSLAYVSINDGRRTLSFIPSVIKDYGGESFEELQIVEGATVGVDWLASSGIVTNVSVASKPQPGVRGFRSGAKADRLPTRPSNKRGVAANVQLELHPERSAKQHAAVLRALPSETRKFGKLIDTSNLSPGDLLLSRDLVPDKISSLITGVQRDGGYHVDDAKWTHAAMYVGDGASVVEATFDSLLGGGNVRLTSLDDYCQGLQSLRFRRSKYISDDREGWRVCVRAMSRLGKPYDFMEAVLMWFNVIFRGQGFFSSEMRRPTSAAVICSMLYADSYNEATRRSLGEVSGVCVPAWLSTSDEFNDVQAEWLLIGS
jgi:hypothetical protein